MTELIAPRYTHWFGVAPADASATVNMKVTLPPGFPPPPPAAVADPDADRHRDATASASPSAVPTPSISASASVSPPQPGVPASTFFRLPDARADCGAPGGPAAGTARRARR